MAAGYLDLLQRELRDTVIHPFPTAADLSVHLGIEGQIASTEGSFYIWTVEGSPTGTGKWRRVLDETDIALLVALLERTATVYTILIPPSAGSAGNFPVPHGFTDRPVVEVTGPNGDVIGVSVTHDDALKRCTVTWNGVLVTPATVTCVGETSIVPTAP